MRIISAVRPKVATQIPEPPIARFLFADTRMAWFWLIVRLYVGYQWLVAGLEKLTGHDYSIGSTFGEAVKGGAWVFTGHEGGALTGFVTSALAKPGSCRTLYCRMRQSSLTSSPSVRCS